MKSDLVYLQHIFEAIQDINRYTADGEEAFTTTKIIQDAVIRNLEIIGEAVKNISPAIKMQHPDVPWKQIAGLRDVLIHHYFGVDLDTVWLVVDKRLPDLFERINLILSRY